MAILDSIKDPATGQIKKPILFSMIGAGGLVAYLLFKGKTTAGVSQTGQPAGVDLSGLTAALQGMAGSGGTGGSGTTTPTTLTPTLPGLYNNTEAIAASPTLPGLYNNTEAIAASPTTKAAPSPTLGPAYAPTPAAMPQLIPGSSGAAGGGGGGTGSVIHPIAKAPAVYAGLTAAPLPLAITPTNPVSKIVANLSPAQTTSLVTQTVLGKNQNLRTPAISEAAMSKTAPTPVKAVAVTKAPAIPGHQQAIVTKAPAIPGHQQTYVAPKPVVKKAIVPAPKPVVVTKQLTSKIR